MPETNVSQATHRMAHQPNDITDIMDHDSPDIKLCPHNDYCVVKLVRELTYCQENMAKDCQTAKYYKKYSKLG